MELNNREIEHAENLLEGDVEFDSKESETLLGSFSDKAPNLLEPALEYAEQQSIKE